jgi:opacity protein-like surface antigen
MKKILTIALVMVLASVAQAAAVDQLRLTAGKIAAKEAGGAGAGTSGVAGIPDDARNTAAETHALLRAQSGFNVNQTTSEYRSLRASVFHLGAKACGPTGIHLPDVIRESSPQPRGAPCAYGRWGWHADEG